jgi:aminodeoxyfutalosine synthase
MLFGHIESLQHRIEHLDKLRKLQDKTGGFICFIPLPFIPHHSRLNIKKSISGIEKLKTIALSRIMLDNIPHIKSYWIMLGIKLAQAALYFGADDIDGTVVEEKIGHMAGANSPDVLTKNELIQMIKGCDLIPIERNGLFQYVK